MSKWAMNLGAWIVSLWLPAIQAAEDNLYFSGTLVNEPCMLAEGDKLIEMDFKSVIDKDLYLNGRTKGRPIELHLQNCELDVGKRMVSITFSGNESSAPPRVSDAAKHNRARPAGRTGDNGWRATATEQDPPHGRADPW